MRYLPVESEHKYSGLWQRKSRATREWELFLISEKKKVVKMPPVFDSSEEKTNGTRLLRLVIDGGTYVLREFLHSIHPPTTLQGVFNNNIRRLNYLRYTAKPRVISQSQWEQLFPVSGDPPDSATFDITLLHLLLREVCSLTAPSTGWHNLPTDGDVSREANIVRIKCYRNELCHSVSTGISNVEFEDKWNVISSALVVLGLGQKEVDRLKTEPIDHDTENRVEEEVKKWKLEFEPRVENLEKDVLKMKGEVSRIQGSILEQTTHELPNCLPDEVTDVFGRSQEIRRVTQSILTGQVAAVVVTGGPGFGKTAVANKVGHELAANQENVHAVLFCSLRSKATVDDVAASMILTCSKNHSQPPENPQHWLRNWSKQQEQKVTFILDNADDVLESGDRTGFISILQDMRMLSKCNVTFVITTRKVFKDPILKMKEVRLTPLSPEEAKKLLVSKVLDEGMQQKLSKTEKLVELCGCVPLALCIVGSLLSDYAEDELMRSLKEKPMDVLREDESDENSVEKAIKTSFDFLSESEQKALVLMSVFPGSFNSDAAQAVITSTCSQPLLVLRSLKNRSLLEKPASDRYQIHQLIQAFAREIGQAGYSQALVQGERVAFCHFISRLVNNANMYWSKDKCHESIASFNEDRHNFEYSLQFYLQGSNHQDPSYLMTTLETLVEKFSQKCLYLEMCLLPSVYVKLLEEWLLLLKSADKPPTSKIVELLCLLGHESRKVGNKYKQFLEQAIKLHTENPKEFDREKVSEAFFRNNYARFLAEEGNSGEAKEQFDIGLKLCEEHLPTDYVQKAVTLLYSGREDNRRNKREEAEKKLNEALSLFQKSLGKHVMTALLLKDLADFHLFHGEKSLGSQEDRQKSIPLYEQALEMMENLGIKDHKECILTLTNLGICHQLQDKMEEAMKLYQASLNIAERELAENHRWKIYVKTQMAFWYKENGNVQEAKAWKDQAMAMSDALALPDNQPPNKFLLHKI